MLPVEIETWIMNIGVEGEPEFVKHHEMRQLYMLPDLSPSSFDTLSEDFLTDLTRSLVFERAKNAFGPNPSLGDTCDFQCREALFCETRYSVHNDVRACLGKKENGSFFDDPLLKLASMTSGQWMQGNSD